MTDRCSLCFQPTGPLSAVVDLTPEQLALFKKAVNPAVDSGFGLVDITAYQIAQNELVLAVVEAINSKDAEG